MIVLDASVIIDSLLPKMGNRYKKASELLELISKSRIAVLIDEFKDALERIEEISGA
jgi:predicted nucleic acid-binding protein